MTKRPLSTISFNSPDYCRSVCDELVESGRVQSFVFIRHFAEQDTKKDHIHLVLVPAKPIDPMKVRKLFIEPSLDGKGDLGCLPFSPSKLCDWLLYALHFPPYLLRKGLVRVNTYRLTDFVTNEPYYYLEQLFSEASEGVMDSRLTLFIDRIRHGDTFGEILASGLVPPSQIIFYDKVYRLNSHRLGEALDENNNDTLSTPF